MAKSLQEAITASIFGSGSNIGGKKGNKKPVGEPSPKGVIELTDKKTKKGDANETDSNDSIVYKGMPVWKPYEKACRTAEKYMQEEFPGVKGQESYFGYCRADDLFIMGFDVFTVGTGMDDEEKAMIVEMTMNSNGNFEMKEAIPLPHPGIYGKNKSGKHGKSRGGSLYDSLEADWPDMLDIRLD